ncbi:radical SAM/SPASM domain-containing protein [Candidatus Riflebacteria bacterium]
MSLDKYINVDNDKILFHKQEISDYISKKKNRLIAMEVDLTLACNHRCPECTFKDSLQKIFLQDEIIDKIIDAIPQIGVKGMIISGGGEPCVHKKLGYFARKIATAGVDLTLTTNGQLIHRHFKDIMHNFKRMRLSIDAASPETFEHTHGMKKKDFVRVIENIKKAVAYKKEKKLGIDIGISFLICEKNVAELLKAVEFYKDLGVNFIHFKPMQYWDSTLNRYYHRDYPEIKDFIAGLEKFQDLDFRVSISREKHFIGAAPRVPYKKCHGSYFNMIIGADAKAYTCCHFKYNPKFCYGDLKQESFAQIMDKVKSEVKEECFKDCKMDAINQLIEQAKDEPTQLIKKCKNIAPDRLPLGCKWL